MKERLSEATLPRLPLQTVRPAYDRTALRPGVVHIGVGAFHRAHQAPLFEKLAVAGDPRWGIVGGSLRSPAVRDALRPQDYLYSLVVENNGERLMQVIGALREVIVRPEAPRRLIEAIASVNTHLVTVTVTEKGYKLDPARGELLDTDPEVQHDFQDLDSPLTLPGTIAAGLRLRAERKLTPLTIISCDNMSANGRKLRSSVIELARAHDAGLADWIGEQCRFPNSMVDRIVPATADADIEHIASELGLLDLASVRTEPFSQWVLEDRFAAARPDLEGVQFTPDVAPWERAKLRLLNGGHSAMAYLGGLAGIATVDGFVAERWGREFIELLWDEVQPTLSLPPELDTSAYRSQLMARFGNSALKHRLTQIAMDGSQKIPQRLAAPATELLNRGMAGDGIALAIAAWIRWQSGLTDAGVPIVVDDPLASTTRRLVEGAPTAQEQVAALMAITSVFPERLGIDKVFQQRVAGHLDNLQRTGARATVKRFVALRPNLEEKVLG